MGPAVALGLARFAYALLLPAIALELLYLQEIRDWEWDPRLYDSFPYYDPREIVVFPSVTTSRVPMLPEPSHSTMTRGCSLR